MNIRRCFWNSLVPIIMVALPLAPVRGEISPEIIIASGALSPRQQQTLDEEATKLVEQLIKSSDADVVKARSELLDPFDKAPKDRAFFKIAYSGSVAHALVDAGAMKSPRLIVRLNAMIVTSNLFDTAAIKLIDAGLADANPAVRYWAAKAAGQLAQAKADEEHWLLPSPEQKSLLDALSAAASKESSPDALQQELKSMGRINIPDAVTRLLSALNARVAEHAANPNLPMTADTGGLHELYVDQVQLMGGTAPVDPAVMRKLALVSYRYLALIAQQLVDGKLSPEIETEYWEMLKICEVSLPWAAEKLTPGFTAPSELKSAIDAHDKLGIQLRSAEWKQVLKDKLQFTPEELAVAGK